MITVKIGGSIVDGLHRTAVADIAGAAGPGGGGVAIVHGGGGEVTRVCSQLGKEPKFVTSPGGIRSRYTDAETAEIFAMVMAGRVNTGIVRMLQEGGVNAAGLSGVDGGTIRARRKGRLVIVNERGRRQAVEGGYTGSITSVDAGLLGALLERGVTPVVSPIAMGEERHELLNVDGDRAAARVAAALGASSVLFVTDVDGLLDGSGRLVPELDGAAGAREAMSRAGPGMEKKLLAAAEALEGGVGEALIASGARENPVSAAVAHDGCTVIRGGR